MKRLRSNLCFLTCLLLTKALVCIVPAQISKREAGGFVHVRGQHLVSPAGSDFTIHSMGVGSLDQEPVERDYADIAAMKLNTVTLTLDYRDFYLPEYPNEYLQEGWRRMDKHLALARKDGLFLILQMCGIEGAQFIPLKDKAFDYRIWVDPELQERFLRLWEKIAKRFQDEPQIIGYGIFCEPVTSGTSRQWIDLANKTVTRVRNIDKNHILFIERMYGEFGTRRELSGIDFSPERSFFLVPDANVVYQFYYFERDEYTHQQAPWREDRNQPLAYPDESFEIVYREALNDRGRVFHWDREYLDSYLDRQLDFGRKHNVPMFIWAFGLMKNCFHDKGGLQWLFDVTELFREHNANWSYSDYRDAAFGISDNPAGKATLSDASEGNKSLQPGEETGFVKTRDGYRLFYRKLGNGQNSILIPISIFTFDGLKALARPDRTLIFYDPRNRGWSDSVSDLSHISVENDIQDIEALREHFQLKKFSLVGYSVYGMEVALYAAENPEQVSRIVQLGPVPLKFGTQYPAEIDNTKDRSAFDEALSKKIQALRIEHKDETEPQEFCRSSWELTKVGLVTTAAALQRLEPTIDHICDYRNEWPLNLNNHMIAHFVGSVMKLNVPWSHVNSRVTMPVLTIHGKKDRNVPYGAGREWASNLSNARFLGIDNAAHQSWVDEPDIVIGAIDQFLNGQWPEAAVVLH